MGAKRPYNLVYIGTLGVTLAKKIRNFSSTGNAGHLSYFLIFVFRDSNGAVLVYDITDEDSFQKEPE